MAILFRIGGNFEDLVCYLNPILTGLNDVVNYKKCTIKNVKHQHENDIEFYSYLKYGTFCFLTNKKYHLHFEI